MGEQIPPGISGRLQKRGDACWVVRPIEYVSDSPSPDISLFDKDPERLQQAWLSALTLLEDEEDPTVVKERAQQANALIVQLNKQFPTEANGLRDRP